MLLLIIFCVAVKKNLKEKNWFKNKIKKYLYLSKSAFLVNLTAPNKESSNVKSALCLNGQKFIS